MPIPKSSFDFIDFSEHFQHQQDRGQAWEMIGSSIEQACNPIFQDALYRPFRVGADGLLDFESLELITLRSRIGAAIDHTLDEYPADHVGPGSVLWVLKPGRPYDPSSLKLYAVRNHARHSMTEHEFEQHFGRPPIQDDLHRVCCDQVGTFGHYQCGWCMDHETARFECGCHTVVID